MKFSRHIAIALVLIGVIFLGKVIVDQNHTKRFLKTGNILAKNVEQLSKVPGIAGTGFAGHPEKILFKVSIGIDHTKITGQHLIEIMESYLNSGTSLEPYALQIEAFNKDKDKRTGLTIIAEKAAGSSTINWKPENIP